MSKGCVVAGPGSIVTSVQTGCGPTEPLVQWVHEGLSEGLDRPVHEPQDRPASAEVIKGASPSLPNTSSWLGA
jgi:hypothetical protein